MYLEVAGAKAESRGSPVWRTHVRVEHARLLAARGKHREARSLGLEVQEEARALGIGRALAGVQSLLSD